MRKQGRATKAAATAVDQALQQALAAIANGWPIEAERILRALLSKGSRRVGALHALGRALLAQRRTGEAIAPLEEAARHGADPVVETNLAMALDQSGRAAEAVQWLERATTRQPPFAPAFHELGALLCSLGRLDEAEAVLKRGLELAPNVAELSVVLGGLYLDRSDTENATLAFARALVNEPGHPGALCGFGAALMAEGQFARAAERFRQALARNPADVQARLSLGACMLELGRRDEGFASLRAAVQITPRAYAMALKTTVTSARGRFWLKPSTAAKLLQSGTAT